MQEQRNCCKMSLRRYIAMKVMVNDTNYVIARAHRHGLIEFIIYRWY